VTTLYASVCVILYVHTSTGYSLTLAVFIHFLAYSSGIWVSSVPKATMASKRQASVTQQTLSGARSVRPRVTSNDSGTPQVGPYRA
jgi:hypothetical protein